MHVIANIVSILRTGDTATVGNLYPSLENNTYHSLHDIGLQLVGHFYLVKYTSLIYMLHIHAPIIQARTFIQVRHRFLLSTQSAVQLSSLYW
jgi:hypothetical protein